jgi:hypothetical protein
MGPAGGKKTTLIYIYIITNGPAAGAKISSSGIMSAEKIGSRIRIKLK